jgi:hypothetical protein
MKLEDTMEFVYDEAEEMEAMSPECFSAGFHVEPSVVLDESMKLEDMMEFVYDEAEETEAMLPECFSTGFHACAAENEGGSCF